MSTIVTCQCGKRLKAGASLAGKKVKCPGCGRVFTVEASEAAPPAAARPQGAKCNQCGAPMSAGVVVCTRCGFSAKLGTTVKQKLEIAEPKGAKPLFNLLGIDFTWLKLVWAGVPVAILAAGLIWYLNLSDDYELLDARRVDVMTALDPITVLKPADLRIGSFDLQGDAGAGIKMVPGVKVPPHLQGEVNKGDVYALGGGDQLLLTRDNTDGTHLLMRVQVSQKVMEKQGMAARRDLMFRDDAFTLQKQSAPIKGRVLKSKFASDVKLGLANAKTSDYQALLPPGYNPSSDGLEPKQAGGVPSGWVYFNPTTGLKGRVSFSSFYYQFGGAPGVTGLSANGKLEMMPRNGFEGAFQYNGGDMEVSWNEKTTGWHSAVRYDVRKDISPYKKYEVTLLFELPKGQKGLDGYELYLKDKYLGSLAGAVTKPAPTATAQPAKKKSKGYFGILADAPKRAKRALSGATLRDIGLTITMYVNDHDGLLPNEIEDLRPYLSAYDQVMTNPKTGKLDRYIYVKPADRLLDVRNPESTVIIYESLDGKPNPRGGKLYASGRSEIGRE